MSGFYKKIIPITTAFKSWLASTFAPMSHATDSSIHHTSAEITNMFTGCGVPNYAGGYNLPWATHNTIAADGWVLCVKYAMVGSPSVYINGQLVFCVTYGSDGARDASALFPVIKGDVVYATTGGGTGMQIFKFCPNR